MSPVVTQELSINFADRAAVASHARIMADIEEIVDVVLTGQHPRLRERCSVHLIKSVSPEAEGL